MATIRQLGLFPQYPGLLSCPPSLEYVLANEQITEEQFEQYYVEASLLFAMKIVWRIKEWKLDVTLASPATFVETSSAIERDYQSETQLMFEYPYYHATGSQEGQGGQFAVTLGAFVDDRPAIIRSGTSLFVYAVFTIEGGETIQKPSIVNDSFVWDVTSPLSVSASVSPHIWWPYDPGDGAGPIYDSATGAQLRPFPA